MSQLELSGLKLPRTKPTLALESCADFFDKDYLALVTDVENGVIKFAWDIAVDGVTKREIQIYAESAWAFCYQRAMPALREEAVYRLILPARDIRSTELARILACSSEHIHHLKSHFFITREPLQADGPNSYTVFDRTSILEFLRSRRLS